MDVKVEEEVKTLILRTGYIQNKEETNMFRISTASLKKTSNRLSHYV